jgi:hypothetical protein
MMADENEAGGAAGSAADILGGAGGGAADPGNADPNEGGQGSNPDPNAADPNGGAVDPDWYANLSAEGGDANNPSNRDWIKALGVKDLDGLAKIARDNQKALRESGRVKIPGADAKPEEIAEYHKAIGVPDDPKGYEFTAPKDADGNDIALDQGLLGRIAESAHKAGIPKAALEGVVGDFVQAQLDQAADFDGQQKQLAADTVKGWGAEKESKLAAVDSAARALGINSEKMVGLRNALGADFALNMLAKLGAGMAEDTLLTGGSNRFGISGAEAKQEISKLKTDTEFQKKLMSGDPAAVARWNRLNEAEAAYEEAQRRAA